MMSVLAFIGWIAWLGLGGYVTVAGFGFAVLGAGFCGRAHPAAVLAGLVGLAIVAAALWCAPFTISWRHA